GGSDGLPARGRRRARPLVLPRRQAGGGSAYFFRFPGVASTADSSLSTKVIFRITLKPVGLPSLICTSWSLTHAPATLRNVWWAREMPCRIASSKLFLLTLEIS